MVEEGTERGLRAVMKITVFGFSIGQLVPFSRPEIDFAN
jgi:hypothetical protein